MTAINIVAQRDQIHVLTDAAQYRDGNVVCFASKTATMPQWPGLITCTGSAFNVALFRSALGELFSNWDDMVAGAEPGLLRGLARDYAISSSMVTFVGISATRGPESYYFENDAPLPAHIPEHDREPYALVKLPDVVMTPAVTDDLTIIGAGWEGIDVDADPELVIWSMRKHLAMQRAMPLPDGIGGIGGFAELTTISTDCITQRSVDRWSEDKVGAPLRHGPVNWSEWHRRNPKPGQSRLKREMTERKARKLQVVK